MDAEYDYINMLDKIPKFYGSYNDASNEINELSDVPNIQESILKISNRVC